MMYYFDLIHAKINYQWIIESDKLENYLER